MSPYLLGIDSGLTVTKAVVFDEKGRERGSASVNNVHNSFRPRWVEQDMDRLWEGCAKAIRQALEKSGVRAGKISGVGVAGHGDGLYLVDKGGRPVRAGILSIDSRAHDIVARWQESGVAEEALQISGMKPFAALPAAILVWLAENEPENLAKAHRILFVKDWLRYRLTGELATDPTEASHGFTSARTQNYASETFALYGLKEVQEKMPPIVACTEVAGEIRRKAAKTTGLMPGTPVVAGAHDIDASAVGVGCVDPGQLTMVAGTWSINELVSDAPAFTEGIACRNFVVPDLWMNVSSSPASATNLEWFVQRLCGPEVEQANKTGASPFAFVNREVEAVSGGKSRVFYHPFLYGSPHGDAATAGFFGLRGWHERGHMLRALMEGTVFNHRTHVDALRSRFKITRARLTGGGARSELWSQMFADALGLNVEITDAEETGALGAAVCAGVGTGVYSSLSEGTSKVIRPLRAHEPDPEGHERLAEAYETYTALLDALAPVWPRLG